jgi:hypothetical protein
MNWKGREMKLSRPISRHYTGIHLEGLRKGTKNLILDSRFLVEIQPTIPQTQERYR